MGTFDLYPCYKDSKVPCFGSVPNHWNVLALHYVSTLKSGSSITALEFKENGPYPVYGGNGLRGYFGDYTHDGEYVLIGRQGALCGNVNLGCGKFFASEHAIVVNPTKKFNVRWMSYLLGSMDLNQYSLAAAQPGLSAEVIGRLKIIFPDEGEQKTIARFLDYKTGQIDALITKKEALLTKLAEKRIALISHTVTKGLDPSVPMKDSGVEWLGKIPVHWRYSRLRFLATMAGGMTPNTGTPEFWNGDIPWISPKDMKRERLNASIDTLTAKAVSDTGIRLHESGRVLIVVRGMILAHTFPVAINDVPATINQDMKALSTKLNFEYLAIILRGVQSLVLSIVEESAHGTKVLRTDLFKNLVFPVPPYQEQERIINEINKLTTNTDRMSQMVRSVIDRLLEYRAALITNAVTGKIDVRRFPIPATEQDATHA